MQWYPVLHQRIFIKASGAGKSKVWLEVIWRYECIDLWNIERRSGCMKLRPVGWTMEGQDGTKDNWSNEENGPKSASSYERVTVLLFVFGSWTATKGLAAKCFALILVSLEAGGTLKGVESGGISHIIGAFHQGNCGTLASCSFLVWIQEQDA